MPDNVSSIECRSRVDIQGGYHAYGESRHSSSKASMECILKDDDHEEIGRVENVGDVDIQGIKGSSVDPLRVTFGTGEETLDCEVRENSMTGKNKLRCHKDGADYEEI